MARFKLFLEYEGTRFSGWQIQKNARTVQGEIHNALVTLLKNADFELYGSGRTDAGVHALSQVAHLEAETMLGPEIIRMKLNDALPADINVIEVEKAHKNFHARHDAIARSYMYQISRRRTAFGKRFVWWIRDSLNVSQIARAAALFEGMKNFQSFTADDEDEKSMKVMVEGIEVKEVGDLILIRVVGSHFLWKMVRQIVGVLAEVGRGKMSIKDIERMLAEKSNAAAPLTAPPSGLFLERVYYKGDKRLSELVPMMTVEQPRVIHTSERKINAAQHAQEPQTGTRNYDAIYTNTRPDTRQGIRTSVVKQNHSTKGGHADTHQHGTAAENARTDVAMHRNKKLGVNPDTDAIMHGNKKLGVNPDTDVAMHRNKKLGVNPDTHVYQEKKKDRRRSMAPGQSRRS